MKSALEPYISTNRYSTAPLKFQKSICYSIVMSELVEVFQSLGISELLPESCSGYLDSHDGEGDGIVFSDLQSPALEPLRSYVDILKRIEQIEPTNSMLLKRLTSFISVKMEEVDDPNGL